MINAPNPHRLTFPLHGHLAACLATCLFATSLAGADYYLAPNGSDSAAGTLAAPFRSLTKLSTVMVAGDHAYLRGGTYGLRPVIESWESLEQLNYMNGTAAQPIVIENYPGEKPVFDYTGYANTRGLIALYIVGSHHLRLKGIRITNLAQVPDGPCSTGLVADQSTDNVFEHIEIDRIGGYGFALGAGAHRNQFINCDAHHLDDRNTAGASAWHNANGFTVFGREDVTGIIFDGCRAWLCSDDGFDLFGCDGFVTIRNCWGFRNGYHEQADGTLRAVGDGMGFKLGPIDLQYPAELKRVITGNLAFENLVCGFDENGNYTGQGIFHIYNNTSFRNASYGFRAAMMSGVVHDVRNNISFQDLAPFYGAEWEGSSNSWNLGLDLTTADFQSLDPTGVDGPRNPDGSLPVLPFLKPSASSRVIDRGADVGMPYSGSAPELGAFESTASVTPPSAPSFSRGSDQTVLEDAGARTVAGWATAISSDQPTFVVTGNTNPGLFSVGPAVSSTGTLTYTPAANAAGSATITVVLRNSTGVSSSSQSFIITVTAVNDAPSFIRGANQSVAQDAGTQTVANWATEMSPGPANEGSQTLAFRVTQNSNAGLFSAAPAVSANGTLTYATAAGTAGNATVTMVVADTGGTDNGGLDTSAAQSFTIAVSATTSSVFEANVNFQPADAPVVAGWSVDSGAAYGARAGAFTYGWNTALRFDQLVDRDLTSEQLRDTFARMQRPVRRKITRYTWEIAVPNGTYQVTVTCGDAARTTGTYAVTAEGRTILTGSPTASQRWFETTSTVTVGDGRLSIGNGATDGGNAIDCIRIVTAAPNGSG
ncbi:MAG: hypothetical protein H0W72_09040 [Planctomycetes bacterium]|nr:hypothetical protein [Planctomycetota bacterium]